MTARSIVLVVLVALVACSSAAAAPVAPVVPTTSVRTPAFPFGAGERATALAAISAAIQRDYVDAPMRAVLVDKLAAADHAGRYTTSDPSVFAERITEDMRAASHDRHMWMTVDPAAYAAARAPTQSDDGADAFHRRAALRAHHGIGELRRLPGNLRYLKITAFDWIDDETGAVYDDAIRFLKDGDAIIIDLRGNPGGSHAAVRYLVSHFLPGDVLLLTFLHSGEAPKQSHSLENLPAGRLIGKPLYVLTDEYTGSAAEEFAYHVAQWKLGELVGARTAGAANNNKLVPIAPGFTLSVSFGRPVHAISGTNWDGVGVTPTVAVPANRALASAQHLALRKLAAMPSATKDTLAEYAWASVSVEAALHPARVSVAQLAGNYGEAKVTLRDGELWFQRANRPPLELSPLTTDGLFAVAGTDSVRIRLDGRAAEVMWVDDASSRVYARSK